MATIKDKKGVFMLAAEDTDCDLKKMEIARPPVGPTDVAIDIQYCGMCHTDVHSCNGDWGETKFPLAPGHEIAGVVTAVGDKVQEFKIGDKVGVGCLVDSCRSCVLCEGGLEQHCPESIMTYAADFPEGKGENYKEAVGHWTNGGYSTAITVPEHFTFHIPENMEMEYAGVLLCAGITTFSPLNRHILQKGGGKGKKVGVVGFGGVGHMAVKLAKAMGAEVTVFSRSLKKADAAEALGADILVHRDEEAVKEAQRTFDVVLDTVSASHPVAELVNTIKVGGTYCLLGAVSQPIQISPFQMISSHQSIEGSLIGGIPETQEMLDFCAEHNIKPEYKVIHAKDASAHFQTLMKGEGDASRSVIDISTIKEL